VPGGLYSISIENLRRGINGHVTLVQSFTKGVMVPPIVLDMDNDGIDDILVSCFDGTVSLIDGKTLKALWTRSFSGFEFYATPAPGDVNADGFLDFMLVLNHGTRNDSSRRTLSIIVLVVGEWNHYDYSEYVILNGFTGQTLWKSNSTFGEFTSPLTLQMNNGEQRYDSFIYRQRGQSQKFKDRNVSSILIHGIGLQQGEMSR
jgi:hypothetical protein